MKLIQDGNRFLVRLERAESVPETLTELAKQRNWTSASIMGLGAVDDVELAYYGLPARKYVSIPIHGEVELINLTGNLSRLNDQPLWHLHATVAGIDGIARGGHIMKMRVAVTVELWIEPGTQVVRRAHDEATGLNLLDL